MDSGSLIASPGWLDLNRYPDRISGGRILGDRSRCAGSYRRGAMVVGVVTTLLTPAPGGILRSNSALLTDAYPSALRASSGAAKRERWASRTQRGLR